MRPKCTLEFFPLFLVRVGFVFALLWPCIASPVGGSEITMKSGFRLDGRLGKIAALTENPLKPPSNTGEVDNRLVVLVDDGLRRSFTGFYHIREVKEAEATPQTRIKVDQRIAQGRVRRVGSVGQIVKQGQFDAWGRREIVMVTSDGEVTIIQGITEITPTWTKVEGLMSRNPYQWDMRIATSSIPREILSQVLMNQIDKADVDQRRQIVKLYIESDRYADASRELQQMLVDFPKLQAEMSDLGRDLKQMSARRLFKEIQLRQEAGQHGLAHRMLSNFPDEGIASTMLGQVREELEEYEKTVSKGKQVLEKLDQQVAAIKDAAVKSQVAPFHEEIKRELNIHTLDRFADFLRLADSDKIGAEQKVSLALSGWLLGSSAGVENLAVSLSLGETRNLVQQYLASTRGDERTELLEKLRGQEGSTPAYVAQLILHMKPPVKTESPENASVPGLLELTVPSFTGQADITYYVQLPPEYDPYKRYPAIVTLNGVVSSPQHQINWWAGMYDEKMQIRMGQAARRGYVVIAPVWTTTNQRKYEYSAREHAAVLFSLRDAMKRFSINSDKVFLTGHSMGGDAAWDIALAHPDLWAGVIPVTATSGKYVARYWENARQVPLYFVGGELDGDRLATNSRDLDRYLKGPGFDCVVVEFLGRGHEDFMDEVQRIFDWMEKHDRNFYPPPLSAAAGAPKSEFTVNAMRSWDNFFWWAELDDYPARSVVAPVLYETRKDVRPVTATGKFYDNNYVRLETSAGKATVYLTPDMVNFDKHVTISVNTGRSVKEIIRPKMETILEDVRTRGDRQHPFWAKLEFSTGRSATN